MPSTSHPRAVDPVLGSRISSSHNWTLVEWQAQERQDIACPLSLL